MSQNHTVDWVFCTSMKVCFKSTSKDVTKPHSGVSFLHINKLHMTELSGDKSNPQKWKPNSNIPDSTWQQNKTQWHSTDRTMSDHASYTSLSSPSTSRPPQLRSHLAWPWHPCWGPRGHHYKTWPHHGDCCLWVCAAGPSVLHHPVNGKRWEETESWYGTQPWFYVLYKNILLLIKTKNYFKVLFFNLS